MKYTLIDKG